MATMTGNFVRTERGIKGIRHSHTQQQALNIDGILR